MNKIIFRFLIIFAIIVIFIASSCGSSIENININKNPTIITNFEGIDKKIKNNLKSNAVIDGNDCSLDEGVIFYYSHVAYWGFGWDTGGTWENAIRITPEELAFYEGWALKAARFFHYDYQGTNVTHNCKLKIYDSGTEEGPGSLLTSEPFTANGHGWIRINLSTPVQLNINKDIWVSIEITHQDDEWPMGADLGPAVDQKGDWVYHSSVGWYEIQYEYPYPDDINWNIEAIVSDIGGNQPPVANFTWDPKDPKMDEIINFDASNSFDIDGYIIKYEWDWNNDEIYDEVSTNPTSTHSWSTLGSYPVTLRVTDNLNATDVITKIVNIINLIVPDDYETIQEAIEHSESGYNIFVKSGEYDSFVIDVDLLTLQPFENRGEVIIDGGGVDNVISILDNAYGVCISGFTIKNSGSENAGIYIESSFNDIWDNKFIQNGAGLRLYKGSANQLHDNIIQNNILGIDIDEYSYANLIKNNNIEGNTNHGVTVNQFSTGNLIQDNSISDNIESGILFEGVSKGNLVKYNDFERNRFGIYCSGNSDANLFHHNSFVNNVDFNAWDSSVDRWDNDVEGNYWKDYTGEDANGDGIGDTPYFIPGGDNIDRYPLIYPPYSGQILALNLNRNYEKISVDKKEINQEYINPSRLDIHVPGDYPTIQDAINNSNDGDRIIVSPDTYYEHNIIVDKSLIIMGESADADVIVDGNSKNYHIFLVTADNVDISGFTIKNTDSGKAGILIIGNFSAIHDNVFLDCGSGVEILGRFHIPHNNNISGNTMSNNKWGVYVSKCIDSKVENNNNILGNVNGIEIGFSSIDIIENVIKNNDKQGIIQQFCNNITIKDNELSQNSIGEDSDAAAIQILNSEYCLIENNDILNNFLDGISVYISSNNYFTFNNIIDNANYPLKIKHKSHYNEIQNNTIQTSYYSGVYFSNSNNNVIYKNSITNLNDRDCILLRTASYNKIEENDFSFGSLKASDVSGLRFYYSSINNICFHNNFKNGCNAHDECSNSWDDNLFFGNYWEIYNGVDMDNDGIGDSPFKILGGSQDRYPLMNPWAPPNKPNTPSGKQNVGVGEKITYSTRATDPNNLRIRYCWDWNGDKNPDQETGLYDSGKLVETSHSWLIPKTYNIYVRAKNEYGQMSEWSDPLEVTVPRNRLHVFDLYKSERISGYFQNIFTFLKLFLKLLF